MPSHQIGFAKDADGNITGIELTVIDDDGNERTVVLEPNDDGTIDIQGRGPNGEKRGTIDPTGNGDNPLGK